MAPAAAAAAAAASAASASLTSTDLLCRMAPKFPFRLKQVVYTLSPYETSVTGNWFKKAPYKLQQKVTEVSPILLTLAVVASLRVAHCSSLLSPPGDLELH